jgi:hypothetical protein
VRGLQIRAFGVDWVQVPDGDPTALLLMSRHYTARPSRLENPESIPLLVGPGEKMVLVHVTGLALFAWRRFIDHADDGTGQPQRGVNCAVFRNEGAGISSKLIRSAVAIADQRWPDAGRYYTYVDPARVDSPNAGWCFMCAGWKRCGKTRGGLRILELRRP